MSRRRVPYTAGAIRRRSGARADKSGSDNRSPFAKDRDRLLYTSALRRLDGKSQVVGSTEIGPFHTRLTHSLKVAQLGRRLAEQIRNSTGARITGSAPIAAPDPDLVEFACLAHDIGHPPFGHAGESELHKTTDRLVSEIFRRPGQDTSHAETAAKLALGGFEGNPQTLRILTRLSHKWLDSDGKAPADFPEDWFGLDLTAASIDAVAKTPIARTSQDQPKWGAYGQEVDECSDYGTLKWARHQLQVPAGRMAKKSFECQLMDWCDDVTYAVHDVEDFYLIGMIPLDRIFLDPATTQSIVPRPSQSNSEVTRSSPAAASTASGGKYTAHPTEEWERFRAYVLKKWTEEQRHRDKRDRVSADYLDDLRSGLLDEPDLVMGWDYAASHNMGRRYSHYRANALIGHFVDNIGYDGKPLLHEGNFLVHPDPTAAQILTDQCDLLKELIWMYVIDLPGLATQQAGQRRIIRDLLQIYAEDTKLLPLHYQEMLDYEGTGCEGISGEDISDASWRAFARIRIAADYVSSLTETHAVALHKRLTGAELGGFRDLV